MLDLVFQNLTSDKKYGSKFFEKILAVGIKELKLGNKSIELSVNMVGEAKISELNNKYRHKDKATDVLSFPLNNKPEEKQGILALGDIFICLPFAKNQAKSENIGIETKLAQLTVHGFLHLAGYDHERSEKEAKKMFGLEKKVLERLNVGGGM